MEDRQTLFCVAHFFECAERTAYSRNSIRRRRGPAQGLWQSQLELLTCVVAVAVMGVDRDVQR